MKLMKAISIGLVILFVGVGLAAEQTKWMRNPDVVYVGTPYDLVSQMLQMAKVKKSDLVYDLGCGDGRMLVVAAQKYGCRASATILIRSGSRNRRKMWHGIMSRTL